MLTFAKKTMAEEAKKDLYGSSDSLLENSRNMQALFVKYLAEFTALDSTLNAAYAATWLTDQRTAEGQPTDEMLDDVQTGLAQVVLDKLALCQAAVNDLRYYARKAFGTTTARYAEFGFPLLSKSATATARYIILLKTTHVVATESQADLVAQGMTVAKITALSTTALALETAEIAHQRYMRSRPRLAATRYGAYNKLLGYMSRISSASDTIHGSVPEKRKLFLVGG